MLNSFYWYDLETFGTDPAMDWPAQFAGIRTDAALNEIGEPLTLYCQLPTDHLPHPEACLVTGLSPQYVNKQGLIEPEFIAAIQQALTAEQGTCVVGYNNLRFDDEVIRHCLYRNFYDPYAREWQNGNSRWDLIDLVRLTAALRPEGINWSVREEGGHSFKLTDLTRANGIAHEAAHDALADVRATIALAKLIKARQPKVYDFVLNHRGKRDISALLNLAQKPMVGHVSGMFGADRQYFTVVMPLAAHPRNTNGVVVVDLTAEPAPLLQLSVEQLQERLFTPSEQQPNGQAHIPLKVVHLNRCPVIVPLNVLRPADCQRLDLDLTACEHHRAQLLQKINLTQKIQQVFAKPPQHDTSDPDLMLYSGGFFSEADRQSRARIVAAEPAALSRWDTAFNDSRLDEMLFRYRARHYTALLNSDEQERWHRLCRERLTQPGHRRFGFADFAAELTTAEAQCAAMMPAEAAVGQGLCQQLAAYASDLKTSLSIL